VTLTFNQSGKIADFKCDNIGNSAIKQAEYLQQQNQPKKWY